MNDGRGEAGERLTEIRGRRKRGVLRRLEEAFNSSTGSTWLQGAKEELEFIPLRQERHFFQSSQLLTRQIAQWRRIILFVSTNPRAEPVEASPACIR